MENTKFLEAVLKRPPFCLYNSFMLKNGEKFGAFVVPTGVGATIGGFAGDASSYARKFAKKSKLLVNPNVVNAGGFSGITENMFYVEGYSLDEFFKGNLRLTPSHDNKVGIVFDKAIPQDVLNVHINTFNAVKCVYGVDIHAYEITPEEVGVEFCVDDSGISVGSVKNPDTMLVSAKKLLEKGCDAIAIVCLFDDPEGDNEDYANGLGTDPVGGVEAVLSHFISKNLCVPCAHSPAFVDYQIYPDLVGIKSASEYITPTFLPCILLGLSQAPMLSKDGEIGIDNLDYLAMPYDALGSTPVFECIKRDIPVFAVKENATALDVLPQKISDKIIVVESYQKLLEMI